MYCVWVLYALAIVETETNIQMKIIPMRLNVTVRVGAESLVVGALTCSVTTLPLTRVQFPTRGPLQILFPALFFHCLINNKGIQAPKI